MVNLDGASTIKISLNDLHILLADDAQTTGKTISNRAKILRENGTAHISGKIRKFRTFSFQNHQNTSQNVHDLC